MSPEFRNSPERRLYCDPYRSDVYSLGMTLLSMTILTEFKPKCELPFYEPAWIQNTIEGLNYSKELKFILGKMLEQRSENRPNFIELKEMIQKILDSRTETAPEMSPIAVNDKEIKRLLEALLREKWGIEPGKEFVCPEIYLKQLDVVEQLSQWNYEAARNASSYYFPYIPLAQIVSDYSPPPAPKLSITARVPDQEDSEVHIVAPCGVFQPSSDHQSRPVFTVRKEYNSVVIVEPPVLQPVLMVRLTALKPYSLLEGQVYHVGTSSILISSVTPSDITLYITPPEATGAFITISSSPTVIGRNAQCQIIIADPGVGSKHAEVSWTGRWTIRDLGSRNGTWRFCHNWADIERESNELKIEEGTAVSDGPNFYSFHLE